MLPCDDDDGSKIMRSPTLSSYAQGLFRKANLAALIFVGATSFILNSGVKLSSLQPLKPSTAQALNNRATVMQSNNRGLMGDQVIALHSKNDRLGPRLEAVQQDQVIELQSENDRLGQRLESVQQD